MTFPSGAVFERELALGIALWDVSHLLPKHPKRSYDERNPELIDRAFIHHSGARGRDGFEGMLASAKYSIRDTAKKRGWPGFAYTFWIQDGDAETADRDPEGRLVIYRGNRDDVRSYHTGGDANTYGVAAVLQGNTTARPLSWAHEESLEALLPALPEMYPHITLGKRLGWHSIAKTLGAPKNKAACPGANAEAWLRGYLRGYRTEAA